MRRVLLEGSQGKRRATKWCVQTPSVWQSAAQPAAIVFSLSGGSRENPPGHDAAAVAAARGHDAAAVSAATRGHDAAAVPAAAARGRHATAAAGSDDDGGPDIGVDDAVRRGTAWHDVTWLDATCCEVL